MCQNNCETWSGGSSGPFGWNNHQQGGSVFAGTQGGGVERYVVRVREGELGVYCALLDGRINNKHPHFVNVHAYQLLPARRTQNPNGKEEREVVVSTDRTRDLNSGDWGRENMVKALLGFKRLALIYGPFSVSRSQIGLGQHGDVKVWISEQPYRCRTDFPLNNQQEMVAAFVRVLQYSNAMVASLIGPSGSLREAVERLSVVTPAESVMGKVFSNTCNLANHKNKQRSIIELSKTQKGRADKEHTNASFQGSQHKIGYHQRTPAMKGSADLIWRPVSHTNNKFLMPPTIISLEELPKGHHAPEQSVHFNHSSEYQRNYLHPNDTQSREHSKNLSFTPLSRFGTNEHLAPSGTFPYSHRGDSEWAPLSVGEGNSHINNFDITIINNNVSNYIHSGNKSNKRTPVKGEGRAVGKDLGAISRSGGDRSKVHTPAYFSQMGKHKPSHSQGKSYSVNQQESLQRARKGQVESAGQVPECPGSGRTGKKLFTFGEHLSKKLFAKKEGAFLTPVSKHKMFTQPHFFSKHSPNDPFYRNHTTEFFPAKRMHSEQHESVNETRGQRFNSFFKEQWADEGQEQIGVPTAKSVSIAEQAVPEEKKSLFKKQLKMEFGNLFNIAESAKEQVTQLPKIKSIHMIDSESKTDLMKQSILKDKIKQKQLAFAQLKMEALKVLTDL